MRRLLVVTIVITGAVLFAACGGGIEAPRTVTPGNLTQLQLLSAKRTPPFPPPIRHAVTEADRARARAGGWEQVTPHVSWRFGPGTELLMTDGTVMVQDSCTSHWHRLTPNRHGSYINGTWSRTAPMPSHYAPLYFASAVLPNGYLIVNGGEYVGTACTNIYNVNRGAIYNPFNDTWTAVSAPSGWAKIGDGQSVVLADGTYMLGNCCYDYQALLYQGASTWAQTGNGKDDVNAEEGWTLLPNGEVLVVNVTDTPYAQLYDPRTGEWTAQSKLPVNIVKGHEIGPAILRPNGTVFVAGASGANAVYNVKRGTWSATQSFPIVDGKQLDVADGPDALLTSGKVMIPASPELYNAPAYYYVFDGTALTSIAAPPNAPNDSTYNTRLLVLPTGQVMETDGSHDIEIYTSPGRGARFAPIVTSAPSSLSAGGTFTITGTGFNGVSQASTYGDDAQQATNYPLVRVVSAASGNVYYCRTHGTSFMGVASNQSVTTSFDVPPNIEPGPASLFVVANGVPSAPFAVTVASPRRPATALPSRF